MISESMLQVIITTSEVSRCSLHKDNTGGVWVVTAGSREVWVLPPWAEVDVFWEGGEECRSCFSEYDVWQDAERCSAWQHTSLLPGDWLRMPKGWWHVAESTPGSVMLNFRTNP